MMSLVDKCEKKAWENMNFQLARFVGDIPLTYPNVVLSFVIVRYVENSMEQSTVFRSNKSQAVRLPKPVALPDSVKKVDIVKLGNARLITPAGESWDHWFDGLGVSDDFMSEREQPALQQRESF